jgi:hypothetical protein
VAPAGVEITRAKRLALANCNGLLVRACDELDAMLGRTLETPEPLDTPTINAIGPVAMRVVELRQRRRRLEEELYAITSEWTDD